MKHLQLAFLFIFFAASSLYAGIRDNSAAIAAVNNLLDSAEAIAGTDLAAAESLVQQAENYAQDLRLELEYARSQFSKGFIRQVSKGGEIGMIPYLNAAALLAEINTEEAKRLHSICARNIGNIFYDYHQFDKALEYFQEADRIAKEISSGELQQSALYFKARALRKKNEFVQAIDNLFEASELALESEDHLFLVKVNNQLGLLFKDVGDYDKSLEHFFGVFAYKNMDVNSFANYAGRSFHNIANVYLLKGDSVLAEENFLKAIATRLEINQPKAAFYSYMDLAEMYQMQGKLDLAGQFYQKAIDTDASMKGRPQKFKVYKKMADLAILQNDVESFMRYNGEYTSFLENDLFDNIKVTETEQFNTINLVTDRYFQLVEAKRKEKEMQEAGVWVAIISLLLLASYITFTKVYAYRNKKLLEKELKEVMLDLNLDDL